MVTAGVCGVLGWWDVAGSFISRRTESVHLSVLGWDTSETAATRPGSGPGGSESAEGSGGLLLDRILSILGVGKCPHYNYVSGMNRAARIQGPPFPITGTTVYSNASSAVLPQL